MPVEIDIKEILQVGSYNKDIRTLDIVNVHAGRGYKYTMNTQNQIHI